MLACVISKFKRNRIDISMILPYFDAHAIDKNIKTFWKNTYNS